MVSAEGNLSWLPAADHLDLMAESVGRSVLTLPDPAGVRVASIDAGLADTAAFCAAYDVAPSASANCVVVVARRGETVTMAAVMVLATDRADINKVVRRHLGARKISFADQAEVERLTGMQRGGITAVGLPAAWPILIDDAVASARLVVIGAGKRSAKLLVDGTWLAGLPDSSVLALAQPSA